LAALATRAPAATAERGPSETAEARPARSAPHGTRPKVSVVTPTCEREPYLEHLYRCYRAQTHAPVEWIVLDDGPTPSVAMRTLSRQDPSVRYLHSPTRLSRAQKRNALAEAATGDVIVHFDDDTHYGPAYVEGMLEALRGFDVASLSAWYTYSPRHRFLGFCDLQVPADQHYVLRDGSNPTLVPHARVADRLTPWGQGFSFVYRKTLWERVRFREEADDDVRDFARRAFEGGGRGRAVPDADGTLMWVVGASEGQVAYPQYALPEHLSAHLFGAEMSFYRNAMARRPSGGNADPGVAREAGEAPEPGVRVVLKGAFASSEVAGL
ncbi:MAG TPA: glycosyltransferase, partial [Myxococcota bacterium]|nr:glycosyltransferase [Myxococcota bacterium]